MEVLNFIIYFEGVIYLIDINKMLGFRILLYYICMNIIYIKCKILEIFFGEIVKCIYKFNFWGF